MKNSSTSPRTRPRLSCTRIVTASTMVPTFIRYWRTTRGEAAR